MTAAGLVAAAHVASKQGRFSEAIQLAKAALALDPGHGRARILLAHALDQSGQPDEAAAIVGVLLRDGGPNPDFLYWQSVLLRKAGRPGEALPVAERFVQLRPDSAEAHGSLGVVLAALGRADEGIASLTRAARLDPEAPLHRFNLAQTLIQVGRNSDAELELQYLALRCPGFTLAHLVLGELYMRRGAIESSISSSREAVAADPENVAAYLLLARALIQRAGVEGARSDDAEAEEQIRTALKLDPNSVEAHGMLGFAFQEQGDFAAAQAEFEISLRLNPRQGAPYYGLATCRKFTQDDDAYRGLLTRALADEGLAPPDRAYVHYALGKILEDQSQFERALHQLDAANRMMFELGPPQQSFVAAEHEARTSWVIGTFTAEFLERHREVGSKSELPLLVVGMMRSGTTLVEQILSSHPRVEAGGELTFWHENAERAVVRQSRGLKTGTATGIAGNYNALLREIGPTALRVTDKLPENMLYLGLLHTLFPEARIVHCRRHPVDTCLSIYATPYTNPPDFVYSRANIVAAYRQYLRLMAHWRTVIPSSRLIEVDYEDLVANRAAVTRRLIDFAGLEWSDACLQHESNRRAVKTPSRWQVRQPIYRTSVARWKNFEPWLNEFAELLPSAVAPSDV